jgi:predicted ATPase/class 3 adenylate cyclase
MAEPDRSNTPLTTGAVTFLFTDIEGSTRLWEEEPERMRPALGRHDAISRAAVESHRGTVVKMIGDGMHAAFDDPVDALAAVVDLQRALNDPAATHGVPLRVRCGLHTGMVEQRDNDFFGPPLNRAARIMSAAHGGQVLLSQAVVDGVREILPAAVSLRDLGNVLLKDLSTPEHVYQVVHPDLRQEFPALRSLEATPNNLPQQATRFVGRETALAELKRLLAKTRLVTLTGSGGCGKTRLCLQVAADSLESFPDGVWLVELAPLTDPGLVPQTVAAVLGLKEAPGKPIGQTLSDYLKDKQLLLLLDNCEHLLDACAQLADTLIRQCPQVTIIASSREALGMGGEQVYRVPSLSLPDAKQACTPGSVVPFEAVQLFTDRAVLARPDFAVTAQNASNVASICCRLDGIPLAIELAAARLRSLSVEEIHRKLNQRFQLLTGGSRVALPRQRTLQALIDWSYDLLDDTEKKLFARLSVFAGGWTLEAASHVCSEAPITNDVVYVLIRLIEQSLVVAEEDGDRYRMLETVRQYAQDRLLENGEGERWRDRHLAYFLALAEEAEPKLNGIQQRNWLERLEMEHDNLRSALTWSAEGADAVSGMRLASACWRFWLIRGYAGEGLGWLSGILASEPARQTTAHRAKALLAAGTMAKTICDFSKARTLYEEALSISRELGVQHRVAAALGNLGMVACEQGDYLAARAWHEQSLAIWRELGDRLGIARDLIALGNVIYAQGDEPAARSLYEQSLSIERELGDQRGTAVVLHALGMVAHYRNDYPAARSLHEEALAIRRELGDRGGIADSLNNLGMVTFEQGDYPSSRALLAESLALWRDLADRRGMAASMDALAGLAFALGRPEPGARLCGQAARLREEIGSPLSPPERLPHDRRIASARASFGNDVAFDLAWQQGNAMTLEQAIKYALQDQRADG